MNCETNIIGCDGNPCLNNSTCTECSNNNTMNCPLGFTGADCKTDIDECQSSPCQNNGTCTNTTGSFKCSCDILHRGNLCEEGKEYPTGIFTEELI